MRQELAGLLGLGQREHILRTLSGLWCHVNQVSTLFAFGSLHAAIAGHPNCCRATSSHRQSIRRCRLDAELNMEASISISHAGSRLTSNERCRACSSSSKTWRISISPGNPWRCQSPRWEFSFRASGFREKSGRSRRTARERCGALRRRSDTTAGGNRTAAWSTRKLRTGKSLRYHFGTSGFHAIQFHDSAHRTDASKCLKKILELQERASRLRVGPARKYNPGWHAARDTHFMLKTSEIIVRCALKRMESRGAHWRLDYPDLGPDWGRKNLSARKGDDGAVLIATGPGPDMPSELSDLFNNRLEGGSQQCLSAWRTPQRPRSDQQAACRSPSLQAT